ncbi:MAG: AcrB/AcrD/AcrF family efflux transporter inner rane protein [Myxococcales bacterium]|nr:AcrB/AcrD/AcrF family efflux transporter inner rane protein [Myxococcales bacterium]
MTDHRQRERERDRELVAHKHNTARFFTENRHIAWVALFATLAWGIYGYMKMPKAKDPTIEVRVAVASCTWPGAEAEKVEQLVTRKIEQKLAESANIERIESISRSSVSIVYVTLKEDLKDRAKEWDNIQGRLDSIHDLPQGAGPIQFARDFGDTATLMLTVASPKASDIEVELRASAVGKAIAAVRSGAAAATRATMIFSFPSDVNMNAMRRVGDRVKQYFDSIPGTGDTRLLDSPGFIGIDVATTLDDNGLRDRLRDFAMQQMRVSEIHPDVWLAAIIRDPKDAKARLEEVAGERYSHRQLDQFTEEIQRYLQRVPLVAKVTRVGVRREEIYLEYSQERLASYGLQSSLLGNAIGARNITAPGGVIEIAGKNVSIDPSGEFKGEQQIGDVVVTTSAAGSPVYLRDLVDISREYQSPPRYLNYLTVREGGKLVRTRAITLAINMRRGAQIADFAIQLDQELAQAKRLVPEDLIMRRTSDQPLQVRENVGLFMSSLYEAIALVVLVALIGFWEWRTALLLALCIPITLAMTFGLMQAFGIDIQQISIASLIIALGLLIDDPVVASDAIKNSLGAGWKSRVAAWLGPTKLATAIMFATITNIAAYLPFLTLPGDVGTFIFSLPVVLTLSLIASRIVSMTFVPLLGSVLLRAPTAPTPTPEERRSRGFGKLYYRAAGWAIDHRLIAFGISVLLLIGGGMYAKRVKSAFFPKDLSYLSYVDIWLPEDATLGATRSRAIEVNRVLAQAVEEWGKAHGRDEPVLESITEFDGGGGPRFWFSVSPELQQLNYAQLIIQVRDKEDTRHLVPYLQERVAKTVAGARVDVRELETGKPIGIPIAVRISGEDIGELRAIAERTKAVFRATPGAERVRDDWGADTFAVKLEVDPDRASLANVTNLDVAQSSAVAMNGVTVGQLREGDHEIAIVSRLRAEERAQISDIQNLYVNAQNGPQKVPLGQVSRIAYSLQTEKIRRRDQFRTITVACFPADGLLPSEVLAAAMPKLDELKASLPGQYRFEIGGEAEEQAKSFQSMAVVFVLLLVLIYLALVVQFRHAIKPLVVFAALPYGAVVGVVGLVVMGAPLSFMALLGIISLMGVIVSHVIVLFDFIEEMHERGEPMREALLDAGLMRIRPVLITVIATVLGLVPLAMHGGPLWQPLCYAQIAGLSFATIVTLLLVPVIYTIVIQDLKLVRWDKPAPESDS